MFSFLRIFLTSFFLVFIQPVYGQDYPQQQCEVFFNKTRPIWIIPEQVESRKLSIEIAERRKRVLEFQFIAEQAKQRGLRAWLFGGTASSYSYYVKWDLLRELGDQRFQSQRFDYGYVHIYRSTQDLDIVIDGSTQDAEKFQLLLRDQFPYFTGEKESQWEVRTLKEPLGDKGGLLEDFGFMNQNTDSNSTGMVELTDPPEGESVVRDLRDWHNKENSKFLQDVTEGALTFYSSHRHYETPRAQAGKNPTLFSVVRALIKAFQYDLKIKPTDLELFKREVQKFDPKVDLNHPYAAEWIEKNGKKLFQNAVNIEYAWNVIESIGLRKKLISIRNDGQNPYTLSWWLEKEPLRSKLVGQGNGNTAQSLGITVVAHETSNDLAYESITRSHMGTPNVFISRSGSILENAKYGDGFYTSIGRKGSALTGITIRFKVDPKAREGSDFIYLPGYKRNHEGVQEGEYIIWINKNALKIIPESLNFTPLEYFKFFAEGKSFNREDRALLWKFRRQFEQKIMSGQVSSEESDAIRKLVESQLMDHPSTEEVVFIEWIRFEGNRLKFTNQKIEELIQDWKTKNYWVNPVPFFTALNQFSKNTSLESFMIHHWLFKLLNSLKEDVGDRVLENCLFSQVPALRDFGLRALQQRQGKKNSPWIRSLQKILELHGDMDTWLKSKAITEEDLMEKASYLSLHPEKRSQLTHQEMKWIEPALREFTFLPVFEKIAKGGWLGLMKSESFQFVSYEFPSEGLKVTLGSPEYEKGRWHEEEIQHDVIFKKSFQIQVTPVTQLQWVLVMGSNPSQFRTNGEIIQVNGNSIQLKSNHPIDNISWYDAQKFIERLNELDADYIYRLPTEAEWEFAARAGTSSPHSHGKSREDLEFYAWTLGNSNYGTHEVASLKPNPDGIYDMHGNIWEWVYDFWDEKFPDLSIDPTGPLTGNDRVLRGGSSANAALDSRSASRFYFHPEEHRYFSGFRLVRTPKKSTSGGDVTPLPF